MRSGLKRLNICALSTTVCSQRRRHGKGIGSLVRSTNPSGRYDGRLSMYSPGFVGGKAQWSSFSINPRYESRYGPSVAVLSIASVCPFSPCASNPSRIAADALYGSWRKSLTRCPKSRSPSQGFWRAASRSNQTGAPAALPPYAITARNAVSVPVSSIVTFIIAYLYVIINIMHTRDGGEPIQRPTLDTGHEVAQSASVSNLSVAEVQELLDVCPDRQSRFSRLALLYARRLDVAETLSKEYSYTPDQFADVLTQSVSALLTRLPSEYNVSPVFYHSDDRKDALKIELRIIAPVWEAAHYQRGGLNNSYDQCVRWAGTHTQVPSAGYSIFTMRRQSWGEHRFDFIHADHMAVWPQSVGSGMDLPGQKIPVPLLRDEGSPFSVSDMFISVQEQLVRSISSESGSLGFVYAVGFTDDGERMHLRNGYAAGAELMAQIPSEYQEHFLQTRAADMLRSAYGLLKVVSLP